MYGLEAISNAHGWSMALAGALIVISGLALLSFIISQFPRLVGAMENAREKRKQRKLEKETGKVKMAETPEPPAPVCFYPLDADMLTGLYEPLVKQLGESFELKDLYDICRENDLPHVHLSIRSLRECGKLSLCGDGVFSWKK